VDIAKDSDGSDTLRAFLRAGATISDDEMQQCWNAAVDATQGWIKPGFDVDAPEGVVEFVTNVAAHLWRVRDTGGDTQSLPIGTWSSSASVTRNTVRRYAVLGGIYVHTPRTVA
jgi:hypothetical protein